jgi:hypothetical protein
MKNGTGHMRHEDFMETTFVNTNGYVLSVDNRHPKFPQWVATVETLNPDYVNLIAASMLLYRTAQEAVAYMEALVEYLEKKGLDEAVPSVAEVQGTLNSAMKIAREGFAEKKS